MGLYGVDVSMHNMQGGIDSQRARKEADFVIIKASEGATWKDKTIGTWVNYCQGKTLGFYHYARPENGNSPTAEAGNFLEAISPYMENGAILALDWEGKALQTSYHWIEKWLTQVMMYYQGTPLIYIQQSALDLVPPLNECNYGLWVAQWNNKPALVDTARKWAFHQYDSDGIDRDYFNGNKEQLQQYLCHRYIQTDDREGQGYCGCTCECYKRGYEDGKRCNS